MNKTWFTSDWHFNHDKPFIWQARGFQSVEEMNEEIIRRHNSVVSPEDTVYVLGDLCMSGDIQANEALLNRLNGTLLIISGNHDTLNRETMYTKSNRRWLRGYADMLRFGKKRFYLSHYPTLVGNHNDDTPWCLHGHTHSTDKFELFHEKCYNIGMDAHNCYPVDLETIIEDIRERKNENSIG